MANTRADRAAAVRAQEHAEDAAEERAEDRREDARAAASTPKAAPVEPFNPPKIRDHYPRWITATIPDVGEAAVIVHGEAQEASVKAHTASFKVTKSAQGDSYEVV